MAIKLDDLTIILPTRNEANNIAAFLNSIPPSVKLIVVDASDDQTPRIITALRPKNTTVICQPASVTEARQIGVNAAKTPWLLFSDADVVFDSHYFYNLRRQEGDLIYGPKLSKGDFLYYYKGFKYGQRFLHSIGIPAASGSNLLVRRSALKAVGGFDLRLNCNEDSELAWRIKRAGYKTVFASDLIVYERDHRRLYQGRMLKTVHSLTRCTLLYLNLMPSRWRNHDWGYWSESNRNSDLRRES